MVTFSRGCRQALEAIRARQTGTGAFSFGPALVALVDLLPGPAISHALSDNNVWQADARARIREAVTRDDDDALRRMGALNGANYVNLVDEVEKLAERDGAPVAYERHLARAIAEHATSLRQISVNPEALVEVTTAREGSERPDESLRIARLYPAGEGQLRELDRTAVDLSLGGLLELDEQGGRIDWKRSILNIDQAHLQAQETVAVALVNSNPEDEVFLVFGVDDDKVIRGQVSRDKDPRPLTEKEIRASQRRLDQRLQVCVPSVLVRWAEFDSNGKGVLVARMRGRRKGTAVRTTYGAYPYRSGEDTYSADPATIAGWVAEEDPMLRTILDQRATNDQRLLESVEELVAAQREQRDRDRDQEFPRLDIVGSAIEGSGGGSVTLRQVSGRMPVQAPEVWVLRRGIVSIGSADWLASRDAPDEIRLKRAESGALVSSPFPEWATLELPPNEVLTGVFWRTISNRRGRLAVRWVDGQKTEMLVDEWDY